MNKVVDTQIADLAKGSRRALSKAITMVESTREDHRVQAQALLAGLGGAPESTLRIGISGTPGVGKSSFVEAFGIMLVEQGLKVAVLAVDPSSTRSGGSILGDKTRMDRLARHPNAFIRPSPSQTALGGVARRTREAIRLCEAAGYDIILVETVGVGQSETMVADMTDLFILMLAPAGGDELQGVKRGIMEIADIILVNKADGEMKPLAERTRADYAGALHLMRRRPRDPEGFPKAVTVSALTGDGLEAAWQDMFALADARRETGAFSAQRKLQSLTAFRREVEMRLIDSLRNQPDLAPHWDRLEAAINAGEITPDIAAADLLAQMANGQGKPN